MARKRITAVVLNERDMELIGSSSSNASAIWPSVMSGSASCGR